VGGYDLPRGKGQREFLRAAACIHAQVPNARFLIVGRGNMDKILRADIERLVWRARPGSPLIAGHGCGNECARLPSASASWHRSFPGVVLEAFACGKPVVASALDGIPEAFAVCRFGQLVFPHDVDALAQATLAYAQRPAADTVERQRLHDLVEERFSVQASSRSVAAFYGLLVKQLALGRSDHTL